MSGFGTRVCPLCHMTQLGPQSPVGVPQGPWGWEAPFYVGFWAILEEGGFPPHKKTKQKNKHSKTHVLPLGLKFMNTALPSLSQLCLQFSPPSFSPCQVPSHRGAVHDPLRGAAGGVEVTSSGFLFGYLFFPLLLFKGQTWCCLCFASDSLLGRS